MTDYTTASNLMAALIKESTSSWIKLFITIQGMLLSRRLQSTVYGVKELTGDMERILHLLSDLRSIYGQDNK